MASHGRPLKLTPKVKATICEKLAYGCTLEDSALAAGVTYTTFNNWRILGKEAYERWENGQEVSDEAKLFLDFFVAVNEAEAQAANDMQALAYNAAQTDPAYARWWLTVRRPKHYAPRQEMDLTSDGKAMAVQIYLPDNNRQQGSDGNGDA